MNKFNIKYMNEARVTRTIDPKLWATMSSTSSKNKANGAVNIKPLSKDLSDNNILLQKYVAGLLTIKALCPASESDIEKIGSYHLFGSAYLENGGTLSAIQKLYVENGGVFNGDISSETPDYPSYEDADKTPEDKNDSEDFPGYDEVDINDDDTLSDNNVSTDAVDDIKVQNTNDFDTAISNKVETKTSVLSEDSNDASIDPYESTFEDLYTSIFSLKTYFKSLPRTFIKASVGDFIVWDDKEGLTLSKTNNGQAIAKCVCSANKALDKAPRFMCLNIKGMKIGVTGNNNIYDPYYFKTENGYTGGKLSIKPGSNYYYQEEIKGQYYTSVLRNIGNVPALKVSELLGDININISNSDLKDYITKYIQSLIYIPTLPELVKCLDVLDPATYWTSSISDNGSSTIAISVKPDKIYKITDADTVAKTIGFIKF